MAACLIVWEVPPHRLAAASSEQQTRPRRRATEKYSTVLISDYGTVASEVQAAARLRAATRHRLSPVARNPWIVTRKRGHWR